MPHFDVKIFLSVIAIFIVKVDENCCDFFLLFGASWSPFARNRDNPPNVLPTGVWNNVFCYNKKINISVLRKGADKFTHNIIRNRSKFLTKPPLHYGRNTYC